MVGVWEQPAGVVMNAYADDAELEGHFERKLVAVLGEDAWEQEKAAGSTMTLEEAIAGARVLCDLADAAASADS
jgi:hypothetical protein